VETNQAVTATMAGATSVGPLSTQLESAEANHNTIVRSICFRTTQSSRLRQWPLKTTTTNTSPQPADRDQVDAGEVREANAGGEEVAVEGKTNEEKTQIGAMNANTSSTKSWSSPDFAWRKKLRKSAPSRNGKINSKTESLHRLT